MLREFQEQLAASGWSGSERLKTTANWSAASARLADDTQGEEHHCPAQGDVKSDSLVPAVPKRRAGVRSLAFQGRRSRTREWGVAMYRFREPERAAASLECAGVQAV